MAKKSPVLLKLEEIGLEQYASALIDDQGYDSMDALEGLTKDQAVEIAEDVQMKPGHKRTFIAAFVAEAPVAHQPGSPQPVAPQVQPAFQQPAGQMQHSVNMVTPEILAMIQSLRCASITLMVFSILQFFNMIVSIPALMCTCLIVCENNLSTQTTVSAAAKKNDCAKYCAMATIICASISFVFSLIWGILFVSMPGNEWAVGFIIGALFDIAVISCAVFIYWKSCLIDAEIQKCVARTAVIASPA